MNFILSLQAADADHNDERFWSTWSLVGCASSFSAAVC